MKKVNPEKRTLGLETLTQTVADFRAELDKRDLARHLAFFYRSSERQLEIAATYIDYGLQLDHRCLYLADTNTPQQIKAAFRSANIDVAERVDAGDLLILDATDVYLDGGFDPERMISLLEDASHDSVIDGYDGLWAAGENTWWFPTEVPFDDILDFEVEFDTCCPDLPVTALCQYDLTRFSEQSAAKALWTHEQIIYRNRLCENPYYLPPEKYRSTADPHLNAQLMLEQMYDLAQARQQADRRKQRLAVVNRVLRHNIRNDLNVVQGLLRVLQENAELDSETQDRLATATQYAERVVEMAEKARSIQDTLGTPTVKRVELAPILDRTVSQIEDTYPEATITITGTYDLSVLADTELDTALEEILTNAIVHQKKEPPTVSLTVSTPSADTVRLDVRNPGSPLPESDQQVLQQGHETPLKHGNGLGLWHVKWIVENAHGSLEFPEDEDDECQVRIELHQVRG